MNYLNSLTPASGGPTPVAVPAVPEISASTADVVRNRERSSCLPARPFDLVFHNNGGRRAAQRRARRQRGENNGLPGRREDHRTSRHHLQGAGDRRGRLLLPVRSPHEHERNLAGSARGWRSGWARRSGSARRVRSTGRPWWAESGAARIQPSRIELGRTCGQKETTPGGGSAGSSVEDLWLRGTDSNRRPSGYEPDELPLLHPATANSKASCRIAPLQPHSKGAARLATTRRAPARCRTSCCRASRG